MPRRRPKTRVDHLVDALEALEKASASLQAVNLRTTSGDLRKKLRSSRELSTQARAELVEALRLDVPAPVSHIALQEVQVQPA